MMTGTIRVITAGF